MQRYDCCFTRRTFSLLPDGLLPYRYQRTIVILRWLKALFLDRCPSSTYARRSRHARSSIRGVKAAFAGLIRHLRLPGQEGSLEPEAFLRRLFGFTAEQIAEIFRDWKELEPKHSLVGIHPR